MKNKNISIRYTTRQDSTAVHSVIRQAFGRELEVQLVQQLQLQEKLLSLVAVEQDQIVGHICFSQMQMPTANNIPLCMGLAPVSVLPSCQGRRIGSRLIQEGLDMCLRIGAHAVFVLGSSRFYPRFGFRPAADYGLTCEYDVPEAAFMVIELRKHALINTKGRVMYHPAFKLLNNQEQ